MAVVKDYYNGSTRVIIRDDCCCAPEEVEKILKRIAEKASRAIYAEMISKEETT